KRQFFEIRSSGREMVKIRKRSFLSAISCLAESPLVSQEGKGAGCFCRVVGERSACPRKEVMEKSKSDGCFDENKATTRCLTAGEACSLARFFKKREVARRLAHLVEYSRQESFSPKFKRKRKNQKTLALLEELKEWGGNQEVPFIGRKCAYYFTDIL